LKARDASASKKTDARKEKQIGGSANSASGAQAKTPPLHDLSGKMKLLKFYTITFHCSTEVAKIKLPALYKKIIYKNINLRLIVRHD